MSSAADVAIYRDVVFSRPVGFRPLSLDLFVPVTPAAGVCIYLHGGGWRVGSRTMAPGTSVSWEPSFFEQIAASGIALASLDYRLTGEAIYPAQLDDVAAAVDFLADHRRDYGITSDHTVAWGVSAGGQLAAAYALTAAGQRTAARTMDAVVCWYTPTDILELPGDADAAGGKGDSGPQSREALLIGGSPSDNVEAAKAASPTHLVRAGAPPFLFLHGDADNLVPAAQSRRLLDALLAVGSEATLELVPGATHMFPELDHDQTHQVVDRSVQFLLSHIQS